MFYSVKEMAKEIDVSPFVINKYIKRFKLKGHFIQKEKNKNILYFPQTVFDIIRDTIEGNKVVENNYYTTQQVADLAGVSTSCVCNIATRNNIYRIVRPAEKSRVAFYPKESAEKIIEIISTRRDKRYKATVKKAEETEKETLDLAEIHPLVKDKRCLHLSYWPDITPKCFKDLED